MTQEEAGQTEGLQDGMDRAPGNPRQGSALALPLGTWASRGSRVAPLSIIFSVCNGHVTAYLPSGLDLLLHGKSKCLCLQHFTNLGPVLPQLQLPRPSLPTQAAGVTHPGLQRLRRKCCPNPRAASIFTPIKVSSHCTPSTSDASSDALNCPRAYFRVHLLPIHSLN